MAMSSFDVQGVIRAGGSVTVDAGTYSTFDLQGFAGMLHPGSRLKITNSQRLSAFDQQGIAGRKPGQVDFE